MIEVGHVEDFAERSVTVLTVNCGPGPDTGSRPIRFASRPARSSSDSIRSVLPTFSTLREISAG
jgi:hypothetical protein